MWYTWPYTLDRCTFDLDGHGFKTPLQECGTPGFELLSGAMRDQPVSFMDQLDLVFKWISLRLCEKENVKAMGQV